MIITNETKEFIEFAWGCINRARYADSKKIVDTYNEVFADRKNFTKKPYTSCGSCLRQYCAEMKRELDALLAKMEKEQVDSAANDGQPSSQPRKKKGSNKK